MAITLTRNQSVEAVYRDNAVAARAVDATKVYGKGEAEVRALDGVTVDFATSRFTAITQRSCRAGSPRHWHSRSTAGSTMRSS